MLWYPILCIDFVQTQKDKLMQHQEYNGWTNQETWLINMWFGDEFIYNLIKEDGVSDAETLKDILEEYILPEQGDGGSRNGYITDVQLKFDENNDWTVIQFSNNEWNYNWDTELFDELYLKYELSNLTI